MFEDRGIVDQHGQRPQRGDGIGDDPGGCRRIGEIAGDDRDAPAFFPNCRRKPIGLVARTIAVDGHRPAMRGDILDDGAADAPGAAGDERDRGLLGHND